MHLELEIFFDQNPEPANLPSLRKYAETQDFKTLKELYRAINKTALLWFITRPGIISEEDSKKLAVALEVRGDSGIELDSWIRKQLNPVFPEVVKPTPLNAAEAVYGFAGWLTSREAITVMSEFHNANEVAKLVDEFIRVNNLGDVSDQWPKNLIHPTEAHQKDESSDCDGGCACATAEGTVPEASADLCIESIAKALGARYGAGNVHIIRLD